MNNELSVEVVVDAPIEKIWECWTKPEHITQWCFASSDWHAPKATNDMKVGGKFTTRMESKDGTEGFDFGGTYTNVEEYKQIEYTMDDGRKVNITFVEQEDSYKIIEAFEPENENPIEMQRQGWQSVLDNFKGYVESNK